MFITFEGGEGSGKTTQLVKLKRALETQGFDVVATREPGGTKLGEHVRNCLLNPNFGIHFGSRAELLLFLASRAQQIEEVIRPALSEGRIVLCDRFNDSSIAYQGGGRGLGVDHVQKLCHLACDGFEPSLTFLLDIDPREGMGRLKRERDRLEDAGSSFHHQVRDAFHRIARENPDRVHVIDASRSIDDVFEAILKVVDAKMARRQES